MSRYPFDRLLDAMRVTTRDACSLLRISGTAAGRYQRNGLTAAEADLFAVRAGFDPYLLWPELLDDAIADITRTCAAPDCGTSFVLVPRGWKRKYCSAQCRERTWKRERYATDPEFRERIKARRLAYYAECRDYERARQNAYDRRRSSTRRPPKSETVAS